MLAPSSFMSARVRLSPPIFKVAIILSVKSCLVVTILRLDARVFACDLRVAIASSISATAPAMALAVIALAPSDHAPTALVMPPAVRPLLQK